MHVDNIIMENDGSEKWTWESCSGSEFEVKKLRRLKYFLEIEVAHSM